MSLESLSMIVCMCFLVIVQTSQRKKKIANATSNEQHVFTVPITVGDLFSRQVCAICKFSCAEHIFFDKPSL